MEGLSSISKRFSIHSMLLTMFFATPIFFILNSSRKLFPLEKPFNSFLLSECSCQRSLMYGLPSNTTLGFTTCSEDAFRRGSNQQIVSFSFYGDPNTPHHKAKQYFTGIKDNLKSLSIFYPGWSMRLYHDLYKDDPLHDELCNLACSDTQLDLCNVNNLPGVPIKNASLGFPMNWKFFPTLDSQVKNLICDLIFNFETRFFDVGGSFDSKGS